MYEKAHTNWERAHKQSVILVILDQWWWYFQSPYLSLPFFLFSSLMANHVLFTSSKHHSGYFRFRSSVKASS